MALQDLKNSFSNFTMQNSHTYIVRTEIINKMRYAAHPRKRPAPSHNHTHSAPPSPPTALPSPPLLSAVQPAEARPSPVARLALPLLTLQRPEGLLHSTCAKGTRQ